MFCHPFSLEELKTHCYLLHQSCLPMVSCLHFCSWRWNVVFCATSIHSELSWVDCSVLLCIDCHRPGRKSRPDGKSRFSLAPLVTLSVCLSVCLSLSLSLWISIFQSRSLSLSLSLCLLVSLGLSPLVVCGIASERAFK